MKKFFGKIVSAIKKFFKLLTNKWLLKGTTTVIVVALVIACYAGINWVADQIRVEDIDFTENKQYSLSDETRKRLDELDTEITIQLINMKEYPSVVEYADKYRKASNKINVEEIDDLNSRVDLKTKYEINTTDNIIVIKNGDREKVLTIEDLYEYVSSYEIIDITEEAISNSIIEVTIAEKTQIYVLSGKNYYPVGNSLGIIATKLIEESNDIKTLDIITEGKIPDDCDCLIMTTLKQDLSELEKNAILDYINKGGNLLMLTSQGIFRIDTPNFDQILSQYGMKLGFGAIFEQDPSKKVYDAPNMILADTSASFMDKLNKNLKLFIVSPGKIEFEDEGKLEELGVTYEVIASTSEKSFVRTNFEIQSDSRTEQDSNEGENVIGALANKKVSDDKTSQLIVFSDETFVTPTDIRNENGQVIGFIGKLYNNEDVVLNSIYHLTERENAIIIRNEAQKEKYTVTDQEDAIILTIIVVLPILIIGAGIVVWCVRRRKI